MTRIVPVVWWAIGKFGPAPDSLAGRARRNFGKVKSWRSFGRNGPKLIAARETGATLI